MPYNEDPSWLKPNVDYYQSFGYDTKNQNLFFNGELQTSVYYTFGVGRNVFRDYLGEWFIDRYNLPVSMVL